jgi:hypothetical protein
MCVCMALPVLQNLDFEVVFLDQHRDEQAQCACNERRTQHHIQDCEKPGGVVVLCECMSVCVYVCVCV